MRIVAKTDIGRVRESNQDSYAAGELPGGVAWAVVCDGMGGRGRRQRCKLNRGENDFPADQCAVSRWDERQLH